MAVVGTQHSAEFKPRHAVAEECFPDMALDTQKRRINSDQSELGRSAAQAKQFKAWPPGG
jgi:hypothetical protein